MIGRKDQGKPEPARKVQVAKELQTIMDSSGSQESEEEVIYTNYATSVYQPPSRKLDSIYGPASGRDLVFSSRPPPITSSDPFGFDRPHPGGPRQTSFGALGQRNFEEDSASCERQLRASQAPAEAQQRVHGT